MRHSQFWQEARGSFEGLSGRKNTLSHAQITPFLLVLLVSFALPFWRLNHLPIGIDLNFRHFIALYQIGLVHILWSVKFDDFAFFEFSADFIPRDREELKILLDAFLLDKAIYELAYELNNRPDWVAIPLQGVSQVLSGAV